MSSKSYKSHSKSIGQVGLFSSSTEMYLREIAPKYLDKKVLSGTEKGACFHSLCGQDLCLYTLIPEIAASLYVGSRRIHLHGKVCSWKSGTRILKCNNSWRWDSIVVKSKNSRLGCLGSNPNSTY